ncbi:MAG: hypothetical protein ACOYOL_04635 [Chthoniobacterales bacterium]
MIQPLKNAPAVWSLCWVDLSEPLPVEDDFFLPTVLLLAGPDFSPLAPPQVFAELDQLQVEDWLARHFDDLGVPDQLLVWKAPEWVPEDWKFFGRDWKTKIRLVVPPPHEARLQNDLAASGRPPPARESSLSKSALAEGLVRNVSRLHSPRKRRATLERAAELDGVNTLARIELAEMEFQVGAYPRGLEMARDVEAIASPVFRRRDVQWWTDRATRPLLRALFIQMLCQWHLGRVAEAAELGQRLLELDPKDHLGARFYTPLFLLLADEQEEAALFFREYEQRYAGDMPHAWLSFAWALTLAMEGDDQAARRKYREGILANIYLAPRLLGLRPPPEDIFHPAERDEPYAAVEFAGSFATLWDREASSLRILRETHEELVPALAELVARRRRLSELMDQRYDPEYRARWVQLVEEDERLVQQVLEDK